MAKRSQRRPVNLLPAGSTVRPGIRRTLAAGLRSGKIPALLLALSTGWVIYDVLQSPRYHVQRVEASGTQALSSEEVATLASVTGKSIWLVDPREVGARVSQSPYVEHASTQLVLPDLLRVTIAERKPNVYWVHDGKTYAVTWDGLIVDDGSQQAASVASAEPLSETAQPEVTASPEARNALTIVDTTPNRTLNVGDHVDMDALELARRISLRAPAELPVPLARIEFDGGLGVSVIIGDNRQAVFGRSDELDRKMATLRYLLQDGTPFTFLDLRPSTPYYRLPPAPPPAEPPSGE